MAFTVAIVGRPNVGKSTLFNRLVGRRAALVAPTPGVTRDRREGWARIGPLRFRAIDTAGLEEAAPETIAGRMMAQTERALADADAALLLIDGRAGVTPADEFFANQLRRLDVPVILAVNKCEGGARMRFRQRRQKGVSTEGTQAKVLQLDRGMQDAEVELAS